ncbi:MAG: ADP-ribosylglycohydrolase family protein, partial [Acutalibacter sp.]|nr:ADP-ribosylglycohydrolase family protein [Acutalibacter sp.]
MYGAILGDIAGSRFEFTRPERFDWRTEELFSGMSTYTDDTVLTIATKYALLTGVPYFRAYRQFGRRYMQAGYGPMFKSWLHAQSERGYHSYGNGSAMRVSYIGWHFDSLELVEREAAASSMCTHDHPEGVKAAQAAAAAVYMARTGASKAEIAYYIHK